MTLPSGALSGRDEVVQVNNLSKKYGDTVAVNGISFGLSKGEVFAFLGPNGAGKTTTVEILECLRAPTGGQAKVLDYDVSKRSDQSEIRKRIGVLPQDFNAIDRLTVRENIDYFGAMYDHQLDSDQLIELVDLKDKRDEQFKTLSGGLKQRVGLAVALVNDPALVFLDEPTTGLDPRARRDVWYVIERLKKQGKTVFLTTHYMDEAEYLADTVSIIDHGQIIASGTPNELIDAHGGKKTLVIREAGEDGLKFLPPGISRPQLKNEDDIYIPLNNGELTTILIAIGQTPLANKEIEVRRPTLDDVFLNLTGRRVSEEGE
ncbi:ABC transporter ATP-binding protein [archaeon 13_1_40CM_4_53_4]|nr:MAG: ABC transporter ATP-binding protein [archaeon 13_2_20CM_2_53_6]OLC62504.1 MAG: ABC transporter ATP-binding protein [archaeon 13_1_40CM_4_53_4]OLE59888.1 MAG: ABC transporter ATP-binding protein [Crenarchaeota archaeon 13_1_20CM_2_53_14]